MLSRGDEYFLSIASTTPLPNDDVKVTNDIITKPRPYTRSQKKKRSHDVQFSIYADSDASNEPEKPALKKSKTNARVPLAVKTDYANPTPKPSARAPDVPFLFSPADPCWSDIENYNSQPFMTPPPTPVVTSPAQSPRLRPSSRRTTRRTGNRPAAVAAVLTEPRSMALYNLLGLEDWKVSTEEITTAWKREALVNHPDRVGEEERGAATLRMQQLNQAKGLLSDSTLRRQYHVDGKLPWNV